jgi:N-acetylmuramoyl-L-alanine amidase
MSESSLVIQRAFLTINPYSRPAIPLRSVNDLVVHYVGNPGSSAMNNRNYFESLAAGAQKIYASSHYIIGLDGEIVQCIPEEEIAYCSNHRNSDTIAIECCHMTPEGKFNEETYQSLINLLADLCERRNLDPQLNIIRHYDVTGKMCPIYYVEHPEEWTRLKIAVNSAMSNPDQLQLEYAGKQANIPARLIDDRFYVTVSNLAEALGSVELPLRATLEQAGLTVNWRAHETPSGRVHVVSVE